MIIALNLALVACNDQGRDGYKKVKKYGKFSNHLNGECTLYTKLEEEVCLDVCPKDTRIGTQSEVLALIDSYSKEYPNTENAKAQLMTIYEKAKGICIKDIKRPTNEITILNNYCACKNNKEFIINNCASFCSNRNDPTPTLYGSVSVSENIKTNPLLGNLYNWCTHEIDDGLHAPGCIAQMMDDYETQAFEVILSANSNNFKIDLSFMEENKTYKLNLMEHTSGAQTSFIQLRIKSPTIPSITPLELDTVSQYSCITTSGYVYNNVPYYEYYAKLHYYFINSEIPSILPPGNDFLYCHDKNLGRWDKTTYPRLELINNSFMLWNKKDSRFYDQDKDQKLDINNEIEDRLSTVSSINLFNPFSYNNSPYSGEKLLGFYLQSFIDQNQIPYCPTSYYYNSGSEIFKILKDYIGDTEAIYLAKSEPTTIKDQNNNFTNAPDDFVFIRESDLKKVWFYFLNLSPVTHTTQSSLKQPIMFYYPLDTTYPLVKKTHQKIFTVVHPNDTELDFIRTSIVPADKRLGCIPKL